LAKEADIYLIDEPSAYLDVEERISCAKAVKELIEKGFTVIWPVQPHFLYLSEYIKYDGLTFYSLNSDFPFKDLYVSPNHALLINGKMCIAKNIVNGITIYQDNDCDNVEYYHLECEKHHAIIANGVLAESYLNVNNKYVFENTKNNNNIFNKICSKYVLK
jgi:hypothetical protein